MERILVTGGAGFIGSTLVQDLLETGYSVACFDASIEKAERLLPLYGSGNFDLVLGDIRDPDALSGALLGADVIIHLAAVVGCPACKANPAMARAVNVEGARLLNQLRSSQQRLIFASTGSVYGKLAGICTENSPLSPLSLYGETKATGEAMLLDTGNAVILRLATAFGLSRGTQRLDLLLNHFSYLAAHGQALEVYEADFWRTFLHVRDISRVFRFSVDHFEAMKDQVYNCGDARLNTTKRDAAELVGNLARCPVRIVQDGTDDDQRDYLVSYEKICLLGFEAGILLTQGVEEMLRAYRHMSTLPNRVAA